MKLERAQWTQYGSVIFNNRADSCVVWSEAWSDETKAEAMDMVARSSVYGVIHPGSSFAFVLLASVHPFYQVRGAR